MSDQVWYRNKSDILSNENILVDSGSLWKLDAVQNILVLEDDDQYVSTPFVEHLFDPAE